MTANEHAYIGGSFELDPLILARPVQCGLEDYLGIENDGQSFNSGRAAFRAILRSLARTDGTILIPDYLCEDALIPIIEAEVQSYRLYPVTADLGIDASALKAGIDEMTAGIVLIDYFGFTDHGALARDLRSWGFAGAIILDQVQALYEFRRSHRDTRWADFAFVSFRKFLSVPGGAYLRGKTRVESPLSTDLLSSEGRHLAGAILRQAYLHAPQQCAEAGLERTYLDLFELSEKTIGDTQAGLSALCRALIERMPLDEFAARRRENYAFLAEAFAQSKCLKLIKPALPPGSSPLALPVIVQDGKREALRTFLRGRNIFCPIHWPLTRLPRAEASADRMHLSNNMLSLPIDQRYTPRDLGCVVDAIRAFDA